MDNLNYELVDQINETFERKLEESQQRKLALKKKKRDSQIVRDILVWMFFLFMIAVSLFLRSLF